VGLLPATLQSPSAVYSGCCLASMLLLPSTSWCCILLTLDLKPYTYCRFNLLSTSSFFLRIVRCVLARIAPRRRLRWLRVTPHNIRRFTARHRAHIIAAHGILARSRFSAFAVACVVSAAAARRAPLSADGRNASTPSSARSRSFASSRISFSACLRRFRGSAKQADAPLK